MDEYTVMPNHFHGIIQIRESVGTDLRVCHGSVTYANQGAHAGTSHPGAHAGAPLRDVSLSRMMQWFKTMTTNEYIHNVKDLGWSPFHGKLWQRSFYDRIIRDEDELNRAREYIMDNPQKWELDTENPDA